MRNNTLKLIPLGEKSKNLRIMRDTGVDFNKSQGELFTKKYNKNNNENDIFFFIKNNTIMAILKGAKEIKNPDSYFYGKGANWTNLSKIEDIKIIRIPQDQLIYKYKGNNNKNTPDSLQKRLEKYKREKYDWITIEGLESKIKRVTKAALEFSLEIEENEELEKRLEKIIYFYRTPSDILISIAEFTKDIRDYKKMDKDSFQYSRKEKKIKEIKVYVSQLEKEFDKFGYIEYPDIITI